MWGSVKFKTDLFDGIWVYSSEWHFQPFMHYVQLIGQAGDLHTERQQGLGFDFALDRFLYLPASRFLPTLLFTLHHCPVQ